jgi:hypothetical protein
VKLVLEKRKPDGSFAEIHTESLDPKGRFVDRSPVTPNGKVFAIQESGPPATKVDLLVLGDGYTAAEEGKFEKDAKRLVEILLSTEPYKSRRNDFNVRGLAVPAAESGISNPRKGVWHDAPLGCSFNAFDTDRYVLTFANERLREAAAQAPYDALLVVFNERKYGGGGIYNLWATCAADSEQAAYVFVHEFGHSFAALADEYYSSQVAYEDKNPQGHEPWEPNVTALADEAEVGGPRREGRRCRRRPGTEGLRRDRPRLPGEAEEDGRGEGVRGGDGGLDARSRPVDEPAPRLREVLGQGRRVRGRDVRGEGALPARGRLHHVHAEPEDVLSGLRARDRARDRELHGVRGRAQASRWWRR